MARPKLGESETERLQLKITAEEIAAIDDWRYANRVPSRSEAVRRLIQIGIYAIEARERALVDRRDYLNQLADFANNILEYLDESDADEANIAEISIGLAELLASFKRISVEPHKLHAFGTVLQGDKWDYVALTKLVAKAKEILSNDKFVSQVDEKVEAIIEQMKEDEESEK